MVIRFCFCICIVHLFLKVLKAVQSAVEFGAWALPHATFLSLIIELNSSVNYGLFLPLNPKFLYRSMLNTKIWKVIVKIFPSMFHRQTVSKLQSYRSWIKACSFKTFKKSCKPVIILVWISSTIFTHDRKIRNYTSNYKSIYYSISSLNQ